MLVTWMEIWAGDALRVLKDLTGSSFRYDRDGDAFEGDGRLASGLADSNFSFIPFSSTVVSGDVWGGLSAAML
jgi:hypothetical protein